MLSEKSLNLIEEICSYESILIIQDIDGVCIPLVKNPLTRKIDLSYVYSAKKLKNEFFVLTNGEHGGRRGVNKIIEEVTKEKEIKESEGLYLPGLAAGGIEYQDNYGNISCPGVSKDEKVFLSKVPYEINKRLDKYLIKILTSLSRNQIEKIKQECILDTAFSPTLNLNSLMEKAKGDIELQRKFQSMAFAIMQDIIEIANDQKLSKSFFLHIAPNLGANDGKEIMKMAEINDIGTTDIQLMLTGALKESGLLVLINKFIGNKYYEYPFSKSFNSRIAPKEIVNLIKLCKSKINKDKMPLLIGVGDTVTSTKSKDGNSWLRGGSDRGFLTLIQELGKEYNIPNKVILVDSSGGEVERPSLKNNSMHGVSDPFDNLGFDLIVKDGPKEYIEWFEELATNRYNDKIGTS